MKPSAAGCRATWGSSSLAFAAFLSLGVAGASRILAEDRGRPGTAGPEIGSADRFPVLPATAADLLREVGKPGARAVLMNVWATWCAPCREEFPDLLRVHRELRARGVRLVLVSADFPDMEHETRSFLARHGVDFPTFIKTGDDAAFIDGLERSWSGALPATFVYDGSGALRHFQVGRTTYAELRKKLLEVLGAPGAGKEPS